MTEQPIPFGPAMDQAVRELLEEAIERLPPGTPLGVGIDFWPRRDGRIEFRCAGRILLVTDTRTIVGRARAIEAAWHREPAH